MKILDDSGLGSRFKVPKSERYHLQYILMKKEAETHSEFLVVYNNNPDEAYDDLYVIKDAPPISISDIAEIEKMHKMMGRDFAEGTTIANCLTLVPVSDMGLLDMLYNNKEEEKK